jgi:hypothetical protein
MTSATIKGTVEGQSKASSLKCLRVETDASGCLNTLSVVVSTAIIGGGSNFDIRLPFTRTMEYFPVRLDGASSQKAFEPPECPNIQIWVHRIGNHSRGAKMNEAINTVTRLGNTATGKTSDVIA